MPTAVAIAVLCSALLAPARLYAQTTIAPEDQAQSILDAYAEDRRLPYFVLVIPLHAFNAALAAGGFVAASDATRDAARKSFGLLSDPAVTGITSAVNVGSNLSFVGTQFVVVEDARYVYGTDQQAIEATKFFFVTGRLSGFSNWIGSGSASAIIHNPSLSSGPAQFPAGCCPGDTNDGFLYGHRCVDQQSGLATSASAEAMSLPVTGHATAVYHLNDASTYPANGTLLQFADTTSHPAELAPEQCLGCERVACTPTSTPDAGVDAGAHDAGLPDAGASDAGGGPAGGAGGAASPIAVHHAPPACRTDGDCTKVQRCVAGSCTARAEQPDCLGAWCETPGGGVCRVQADCGLNAICTDGVCVPNACLNDADCPPKHGCVKRTCKIAAAVSGASPSLPGVNVELVLDAITQQEQPRLVDLQGPPRQPVWEPPSAEAGQTGNADNARVGLVQNGAGEPRKIALDRDAAASKAIGSLIGRCPADEEVTVADCLDEDFLDSVCGARYTTERVTNSQEQIEGGERLGLCEQLIAEALVSEPKRRPGVAAPRFERVCRPTPEVPADPREQDPRQGGAGARVPTPPQPSPPPPAPARANAQQAPAARYPGVAGGHTLEVDPAAEIMSDARACPSELAPYGVAAIDNYNRDYLGYSHLYRLDGHALSERHASGRFLFDADEAFDRHEISVSGATGTQGLKTVRRYALGSQRAGAAEQRTIRAREDRWHGRNGLTQRIESCDEYAFQRYYDYFRFEEQAALLGRDDWAVWRLAFGPANEPTSIGTRMLDGTGLRDVNGDPARNVDGRLTGFYFGDHYYHEPFFAPPASFYKNVYFTLHLTEKYQGEFYYRALLKQGRAHGAQGAVTKNPNEIFWSGEGWDWHKAMGDMFSARTLSEFDAFETGDAKDFREARQSFYDALVDAVRQGRTPDDREHAQDCARLVEALPRQLDGNFRNLADRRQDAYDDPFARALATAGDNACSIADTQALRTAVSRLDQLLTRAELKGYLALARPTLADWSPRLFAEQVKGLLSREREEAFRKCVLYTNDQLDQLNQHFQSGPNSRRDFTVDYTTVDQYFAAIEQELDSLPEGLRGGGETRWDSHDAMEGGSAGFGYNLAYHGNIDITDYVARGDNPILPALANVKFGFDAGASIRVTAFGDPISILEASADVHSDTSAHLPTVRVLDLDTLDLETLIAGDTIEAEAGHVPSFNFVLDNYGRAVEFGDFEMTVVAFAIPITISGGIAGFSGADVGMTYSTANRTNMPRSLAASLSPSVGVSAFLEGGVSVGVASASVRTTLTLIDFDLPITARVDLSPSDLTRGDFDLSFDLLGTADFEMLNGSVKLKLCAGLWPFRECWRKKLFEWDAAIHTTQELFALSIEPFSLAEIVTGRKLALARECAAGRADACEQQ